MSKKFNVKAHHIKHALAKKHENIGDFFLTEVKNGPTHFATELLIMDALAIKKSWANPLFQGYEIKVSRQDFLNDNKWHGYLNYCHRFSFVCPTGLIAPEELPDEIGLIYYNAEKGTLYTKRKAVHRSIELSADLMYYIIMSRMDSDRHPFFSSKREAIEEYLLDKVSKGDLAYRLKTKLTTELKEAHKAVNAAERQAKKYETDAQAFKDVLKILEEHGIHKWNWEEDLRDALAQTVPQNLKYLIKNIYRNANELNEIVAKDTEVGA